MQSIVLGGGCFWCLEAAYSLIRGVDKVAPGYAGGRGEKPSYHSLHESTNGWAEVVKVTFDECEINLEVILDIFWTIHDPTTLNRQGYDKGPQYRSIILYINNKQKKTAEISLSNAQKLWKDPIVTDVAKLDKFYEAELEHHNYFANHPEQAYCQLVIIPKLKKLQKKFSPFIE